MEGIDELDVELYLYLAFLLLDTIVVSDAFSLLSSIVSSLRISFYLTLT